MVRRWSVGRVMLALTGTLLVGAALTRVPVAQVLPALRAAQLAWLPAAVMAHLLIQPLAATQWRLLLPVSVAVLSWRRVLRLFALTSVANNTANSLVGHAAGTTLIATQPGVGASRALSLLVLDQLCVAGAKVAVLMVAVASMARRGVQSGAQHSAGAGGPPVWLADGLQVMAIAACLLLVITAVAPQTLARYAPRVPRVGHRLTSWLEAMAAVPRARIVVAFGCALLVKSCEGVAIAAVLRAFDLPVTLAWVSLVLSATAAASLIPVMLANVGTYEGSVTVALTFLGVAPAQAVVVAIVLHVTQLLAAIVPGLVVAWLPTPTDTPVGSDYLQPHDAS